MRKTGLCLIILAVIIAGPITGINTSGVLIADRTLMVRVVSNDRAYLAWEAPRIVIGTAHPEEKELFTITNNLGCSVHVYVDLTEDDGGILTLGWGPKECELPPAQYMSWSGVLNGTSPRFYYLVFHVNALNCGVCADLDVTVEVEVID